MKYSKVHVFKSQLPLMMMSNEVNLECEFEGLPRGLLFNLIHQSLLITWSTTLIVKNFTILLSNTLLMAFIWNNCDIKCLTNNITWLCLWTAPSKWIQPQFFVCRRLVGSLSHHQWFSQPRKMDRMMLGIFPQNYFNGQKNLLCSKKNLIWNIHFPGRFYIRKLWI